MKHWSLKTKGLIYIVLVALLPLLISGVYLYESSKNEVISMTVEKIQLKQEAKDYMITTSIGSIINDLQIMARTDTFLDSDVKSRTNYLQSELNVLDGSYISLGYITTEGTIDYYTKDDNALEQTIKVPSKEIEVVIDEQVSDDKGKVISHVAVPVFDHNNEFKGSLFAKVYFPPNYFQDEQYSLSMESTYIYSTEGKLIFHPNLIPYTIAETGEYDEILKGYIEQYGLEQINTAIYRDNYKKYVIVHRNVNEGKWMMLEIIPMSEIRAETFPSFVRIFSSIFITITMASIVFYMYFNSIIKRLFDIVKVTKQGANGTFSVQHLDASIKDEIGILSHSINGMMNRLEVMFSRLDAVINQNQSPVIVLDEYYRFSYLNKAAEKMLGVQSETVIGKFTPISFMNFEEVVQKAKEFSEEVGYDVTPGPDLYLELRRRHANYDMEFTIVNANGERIPVYDRSSAIRDKNGKMLGVISILQDLSEQRQIEQARNRLQEIVESARDLIASVDRQSNIIYINEAGRRMLGIQNVEVNNLKDCLPDEIHQLLIDHSAHARQDGFFELESQFVNRLGERINASISIVSHTDTYTGELLYSCIARDLTELFETQEKLVEATELAEKAAAAKGNFLALMSHEIRTPLNGIIGLSQLLEKTKLDILQREYTAKIKDSSNTLLHIVNDILDFSKLEVSKIELEQRLFNLHNVLDHVSLQVSHYIGGKENFEFKIVIDEKLPKLLVGDSLRLEQVLNNLCVNAVKFTRQGIVRLELCAEQLNDKSVKMNIAVTDTGIGMSDEQLSKLFTPFTQADSSTTRQFGGTGLGLVIAQTLVKLMGGQLKVESKLNVGSKFSFTIELQYPEQLETNGENFIPENEFFAWVIEDSAEMSLQWTELLAKQKIATVSMNTWKEGYYRLCRLGKGVVPSLIIMDMEMADMYGIETWLMFKAEANKLNIPVVVLTTTHGHEELAMLHDEVQPHLVLTKPIQPYHFQKSIYELLTNRKTLTDKVEYGSTNKSDSLLVESRKETQKSYFVLVAEDNKINQLVANEMLKLANVSVTIVNNGQEAIDELQKRDYDLIMMDIHMPVMDGIDATKWIRSQQRYDAIPIIAVTANIVQSDHEHYKQIGMQYVMTKPLEMNNLNNVLIQFLGGYGEMLTAVKTIENINSEDNTSYKRYKSLNIEQAIERLNGKVNIYHHMLEQFKVDYSSFTESLVQNVDVGNLKAAQRMLHTLKGASSYLGALHLNDYAAQMERHALEANIDLLKTNIPVLAKLIEDVLEDIRALLERG